MLLQILNPQSLLLNQVLLPLLLLGVAAFLHHLVLFVLLDLLLHLLCHGLDMQLVFIYAYVTVRPFLVVVFTLTTLITILIIAVSI